MREREWTDAVDGVWLPEVDPSYEVESADDAQTLLRASRVNLLVGANNAGKSRFLRGVLNAKELRFRTPKSGWRGDFRPGLARAADCLSKVIKRAEDILSGLSPHFAYRHNIDSWLQTAKLLLMRLEQPIGEQVVVSLGDPHKSLIADVRKHLASTNSPRLQEMYEEDAVRGHLASLTGALNDVETTSPPAVPKRNYVPVLRGLRAVTRTDRKRVYDHAYVQATRLDYQLAKNVEVETGLTLYEDLRKRLLGKREQRESVRGYEEFLSKNFFEGRRLTLTPHDEDQAVYVDLDGQEHPIHHVGDGLQSVIVLTYQAFVTRQTPGLFFVEEPELFLHPGMQRRLLNFFLHETPHLYFITTHSNHLLDLSMDERGITVYNFQRVPRAGAADADDSSMVTRVRRVNGGDQSSLALLGVRVSSVFLVNATVWVEGITDRLYLREMLRLYVASKDGDAAFRRMEEDTHYSFVEYGGSNITHWSFLQKEAHPIEVKRLCSNSVLMIDEDDSAKAGTAKHKRRADLASALADRLLVTAGREVENMLPERVVSAVLKRYSETDAAVAKVTRGAYRDEPLGAWLDTHLGSTKARTSGYGDDSGTVKGKTDFCERAIDAMREGDFTFADLPPEVQRLVERIYGFIVAQNK